MAFALPQLSHERDTVFSKACRCSEKDLILGKLQTNAFSLWLYFPVVGVFRLRMLQLEGYL